MKPRRTLRTAVLSEYYSIGADAAGYLRSFAVAMQLLCSANDVSNALWRRIVKGMQ